MTNSAVKCRGTSTKVKSVHTLICPPSKTTGLLLFILEVTARRCLKISGSAYKLRFAIWNYRAPLKLFYIFPD